MAWPEVAAVILLGAWMLWSVAATLHAERSMPLTSPYLVTPVALVVGVVAGTAVAPRASSPWLTAGLLGAAVVLVLGVLLTVEPGKRPLGYANANAALAVQLLGLCGLALVSARPGRRWQIVVVGALALVAIGLNRSAAAAFVAVPLAVTIGLVARRPPRRRWWVVPLGAATVGGVAGVVLWLGGTSNWPPAALRAFDPVRQELWADAEALWRAHPLVGAGVGSFAEATPLGVDPDTSAAHSSVLQVGAETGWVGVGLFAAVVLAGLLWAARGRPSFAVIGAATWTALVVHSLVDHLLEFVPVVVVAGVVLGWAGARRPAADPSEELDVAERKGPVPG